MSEHIFLMELTEFFLSIGLGRNVNDTELQVKIAIWMHLLKVKKAMKARFLQELFIFDT